MARADEFKPTNPTARYCDWDQNEQSFTYWDSTANEGSGARIAVNLPFKFLVIRQRIVIMGFTDDDNKDRIYSNEIKEREVGVREFNVRTKETSIAKGIWKVIKDQVKRYGGNYSKILHAVDPLDGQIICIRIKGNALMSWNNSVGKNEKRMKDEFVQVSGFEESEFDGKLYSYPIFTFGGSLNPAQNKKADYLD